MSNTQDMDSSPTAGAYADVKHALEGTFGVKFTVWPVLTASDSLPTDWNDQPGPLLLPCLVELDLYKRVKSRNPVPEIVTLQQDQQLIVMPILDVSTRKVEALATAVYPTHDHGLLLRLARQFYDEQVLRQEVKGLQQENDLFVRQVTEDFEELTFLRSIAESLENSDLTVTMEQMAEQILPKLNGFAHCEYLTLISGDGQLNESSTDGGQCRVGEPLVRVGVTNVDVETCLKLVEKHWTGSRQAVVKNACQANPEFKETPWLRSFVLVPVAKSNHVMGWLLAINRLSGRGEMLNQEGADEEQFGTSEATLLNSAASILGTHATNVGLYRQKEELLVDLVRALVYAIDAKDPYTCGHSERVALYAKQLGEAIGLTEADGRRLVLTGLLHDVGKIAVSDVALQKAGRLTDEEFRVIKTHPEKGWAILQDLDQLRDVLPGVLHHHERWDGKGYPDGLAGEDIPLDARILAVVDSYDAMTSDRVYRAGMSQAKAVGILQDGAGKQWDSQLVNTFLWIMPEILRIRDSYQQRRPPLRKTGTPDAAGDTVTVDALRNLINESQQASQPC